MVQNFFKKKTTEMMYNNDRHGQIFFLQNRKITALFKIHYYKILII